jgi:excinuclease ABC subunit C
MDHMMDDTGRPDGHESRASDEPQTDDIAPDSDEGPESGAAELASGADLDVAPAEGAVARGVAVIRAHWKHAPVGPGVYRMIGADGEVLYVGKAKSVRRRIANYLRGEGHTQRIGRMIALTADMVFVSTRTETEALLLETNLIKQLRPRFNVLMRDDKSFPYILVTRDHAAPQITKHRGARTRKGDYFGPFASVWAVNRTLNALQRAFLLRSCTDSYYENRTRPCLLFQIKRCAGPCTGEIAHTDYAELVQEAHDFLSGKSRAVRDLLASDMAQAAERLEFERAARLRDRIAALSAIQGQQGINPRTVEEADVFAIAEDAGQFCVEVFFFRTFQNWGNRAYFPRADRSLSPGEVLGAFVAQFYDERPAPSLVLVNHEIEDRALLADALSTRRGRKVEIAVPQRGERRELVDHAAANAREALSRRLAESASQAKLLDALATTFGIDHPVRRVEVYDNSHIMGSNAIGAMVVAGADGFMKPHYRTFNIKGEDIVPGDDFGMMREVLRRRFARLAKEEGTVPSPCTRGEGQGEGDGDNPHSSSFETPAAQAPQDEDAALSRFAYDSPLTLDRMAADPTSQALHHGPAPRDRPVADVSFPARPDLVLIDGGAGQVTAARETLAALGITDIPLVGIAKGADRNAGRETFFIPGREPFRLPPRDPALYFVQRLRDEAHRFAIGTHRARRKKDFTKSPLDEIGGIGPVRKRALLNAFGTAKALSRASLDDLEKVPGINAATARLVYDYFHDRR